MRSSNWRLWVFRIAFLYSTTVLVVLLLSSFQIGQVDLPFADGIARSVSGIFLPLLFTAGLAFILSLGLDLEKAIPFKMLSAGLGVAAVYTWAKWASGLDYATMLKVLRNPVGAGTIVFPTVALFTFLPIGALIYLEAILTLGPGLSKALGFANDGEGRAKEE